MRDVTLSEVETKKRRVEVGGTYTKKNTYDSKIGLLHSLKREKGVVGFSCFQKRSEDF